MPEPGTFDVRDLAVSTAARSYIRDSGSWHHELGRWFIEEGIARPNGADDRMELTEHGAELATLIADLRL